MLRFYGGFDIFKLEFVGWLCFNFYLEAWYYGDVGILVYIDWCYVKGSLGRFLFWKESFLFLG